MVCVLLPLNQWRPCACALEVGIVPQFDPHKVKDSAIPQHSVL